MIEKLKEKAKNEEGFTLAELLIVVAIIAVLVAISIPIFTTQLEKSREAVDAANIRSAYAEIMADAIVGDEVENKTIDVAQKQTGWQNSDFETNLGKIITLSGEPAEGGTATLSFDADTEVVTCTFE